MPSFVGQKKMVLTEVQRQVGGIVALDLVAVYFALLLPGDPGQGDDVALPRVGFFIDDGPDLDAGGIAADLLLPPPIS